MKTIPNVSKKIIRLFSMIVFVGFFSAPAFCYAQKSDFSGTWTFNESKSKLGEGRFRAATKITVVQDANTLNTERTSKGREGEDRVSNEKITLDGKECENTGFQNNIKKSIATWSADSKLLNINSIMVFDRNGEKMEIKSSESWSISDDMLSLTIEVSSTTPQGEMKQTLVYDRAG